MKFSLNEDRTKPVKWRWEERSEAKFMVEEYMLLANVCAAEFLYENAGPLAILRRHSDPDVGVLSQIRKTFLPWWKA